MLKTRMKTLFKKEKTDNEEHYYKHDDEQQQSKSESLPPIPIIDDEGKTDEYINTIPDEYYNETPSLTCQYELKLLSDDDIDMDHLMDRILLLKGQDTAVYRKIYDSVFKNYTAYVQELDNVTALELSLTEATCTCINARRLLRNAEKGVSSGGLGLLVKHKKRERLKLLLEVLKTFRTLQKARNRLNELLEEGDFPSATQLCIECQQAIETYKLFNCVSQLAVSLADIHTVIENELEQALYFIAENFNSTKYELVHDAYRILGKTERSIDLLLMKFTTVVHDKTFAIIASTVNKSDEVNTKMQYSVLCKLVKPDDFINCLIKVCKELFKIMCNYYNVCQWHSGYEATPFNDISDAKFNKSYIKQKLDSGLTKLWMSIQHRLKPYLEACNMSQFQYDNFIKVLNIVNRLIGLGIQFCGIGSDQLKESMRLHSLSYFRHYHKARLEELRLFLENEQWVLCPVRSSFAVTSLREFKFMRSGYTSLNIHSPMKSNKIGSESNVFTDQYTGNENPFDELIEEEELEDVIVQDNSGFEDVNSDDDEKDDEDIPAELRKSYVDEQADDTASRDKRRVAKRSYASSLRRGPVLANVTLTVIRFTGNYMQMMNVLEPIAYDALQYLTHLFDYYLYAVYKFFVSDLFNDGECVISVKLTRSIQRINETIISIDNTTVSDSFKVPPPVNNPFLQLDNSASLYGISFRIVALESLVFLAKQFEYLLPHLEALIPDGKRKFLSQFYSQTVSPCHELKIPVYSALGAKSIPFEQIQQSMSSVKWDIKVIMSQHSKYVDLMLMEFEKFNEMLSYIDKQVPIPKDSFDILWNQVLKSAALTFVDGFSQAKKCSNEGRALMQLDYQQFRTKMEKIVSIKPLLYHEVVENYIKAYYMTENDLENWLILNNKIYTVKQLQSLIITGAGGHMNKKTKQRLMNVITTTDDINN